MGNFFYSKLAFSNLIKNKIFYFPFILVSTLCASTYYLLNALAVSSAITLSIKSNGLKELLNFGGYVVLILSVLFILYANSFVIKRRKKEFGLYGILGLEKRHVARVIATETLINYVISMLLSIVIGIVFGKLADLLLIKLTSLEEASTFIFSFSSFIKMAIIYFVLFVVLLIECVRQIYSNNSIDLLKGKEVGEKEPKGNIFITVLSFVCLVIGYGLAISIKDPDAALILFFVAVIFVIIGTYTLFISGSVFILKLLKRSKKIYYKPNNFFSISSLLYRMKQNATGLASICILSCMVLVTLSTTIGLYNSVKSIIDNDYHYDFEVTIYEEEYSEIFQTTIDSTIESSNLKKTKELSHVEMWYYFSMNEQGDFLEDATFNDSIGIKFIALEDYNRMMQKNVELQNDEVIIYESEDLNYQETLHFIAEKETTFRVVEQLKDLSIKSSSDQEEGTFMYVIISSLDSLDELIEGYKYDSFQYIHYFVFDTTGDDNDKIELGDKIVESLRENRGNIEGYSFSNKSSTLVDSMHSFGVILFLGVFLGITFLFGTILIIYYKQISEGYDDRERYIILQKVGMDQKEVKKTIQKQIVTFFFLPLIIAIIHSSFAYNMITTAFGDLGIRNMQMLVQSSMLTTVVFAVIYYIVYRLSAKIYYRLVKY